MIREIKKTKKKEEMINLTGSLSCLIFFFKYLFKFIQCYFFSHEIFIPRFPLLTRSYIILMKFQWNINTAFIKCQDYAGWCASCVRLCWNGDDRMAASFYKESMGIRHGESAFSEIWWNPGFFSFFFFLLRDLQIRSQMYRMPREIHLFKTNLSCYVCKFLKEYLRIVKS